MKEFVIWAKGVGIAIAGAIILAICISAVRAEEAETCLSINQLMTMAVSDEDIKNPRIVSERMTREAVKLFSFLTRGQAGGKFDRAVLMDFKKGGLLFVGRGDEMCAYTLVPEEHWRAVVKLLEGEPT